MFSPHGCIKPIDHVDGVGSHDRRDSNAARRRGRTTRSIRVEDGFIGARRGQDTPGVRMAGDALDMVKEKRLAT